MATVGVRTLFLLVFVTAISHLNAPVVASAYSCRGHEKCFNEVRYSFGEYISQISNILEFSKWLFLCERYDPMAFDGNHKQRRRMTLAARRRNKRRMMTSVHHSFLWMSRAQFCKMLSRMLRRRRPAPSTPASIYYIILLILLCCSDVELNPGPIVVPSAQRAADVCLYCDKTGRKNSVKLKCDVCDTVFHTKCLKLTRLEINMYRDSQWLCWKCSLPQFNDSAFNDSLHSNSDLSLNACNPRSFTNDNLSILCFNARSLKDTKKKGVLSAWLATIQASILCINETWLHHDVVTSEVIDESQYVVFRKDRAGKRGGGVLFAAKPELCPLRLPDLENKSELIWAEVTVNKSRILIGSVYRSPSNSECDNDEIIKSLQNASHVSNKYDACVLTGDCNLQIDWSGIAPQPLNPIANSFLSTFYDFVPHQLVKTPTREINGTASILDLFLCDNLDLVHKVEVVPGVSDHHAILASLNFKIPTYNGIRRKVYNYARADWNKLNNLFLQYLPNNFDLLNINESWSLWESTFWSCVDQCIPKKLVKPHGALPWFTRKISSLIKKRQILFRQWKSSGSAYIKDKYCAFQKFVRREIKNAQSNFLWRLGHGRGGQKALWKFIHSKNGKKKNHDFFVNGQPDKSADIIAGNFADCFDNNFNTSYVENDLYMTNHNNNVSISDIPFNDSDVSKLLKSLRLNSSAGPDNIPPYILNQCADALCSSICALYRKSLDTGCVPDAWKLANVIPVFKDGERSDFQNYRPISITSSVCKVFERIISNALLIFLTINDVIPVHQHGFMPRRSCNSMLMYTLNEWQRLLDQHAGGHIHAVSIDWEKAFDKIPHSRLLLKLRKIGVRGTLFNWFQSYLINRKQRVMYDGCFSSFHNVPSGVIQGSVLGPLLFNIFMSDLPACVSSPIVMYADDSTIYRHVESYNDELQLQSDLDSISLWCLNNGMNMNARKCKFMDVTLSKLRRFGRYSIDNTLVPHADYVKLLGVYVAYDMSWNRHVEYIRSKCAKLLGFVNRNIKDCKPAVLCQTYQSLIRPIMMHGTPGWHPTTKDNISKLQRIQNRASRSIFGKRCSHELDNRIMSVNHYINYTDLLYFYKCRNGLIDSSITQVVVTGRAFRGQEGVYRLIPPKVRTTMYQRGFLYRSVSLWNELPPEIKLAHGGVFKKALEQFCLSSVSGVA